MAAVGVAVGGTGMRNIDALLIGSRWNGTISYSFPNARDAYEPTYAEADNGFGSVSFNQQQAARYILEGKSSIAGGPRMSLTAVEQFTNASIFDAGSGGADIRLGKSSYANPTAYAYLPNDSYYSGDIWFGTSTDYANPKVGNYAYATMMHELGHALGLKHGHQAGGVSNTASTFDRDSLEFSVMTYRSYVGQAANGYTNETYGFAQTFMMYDIAALQHLYGADFATNAGNTVYTWSSTTGETFINGVGQGEPGGGMGGSANRIFLTIWDGGGIDTYDFSNYGTTLRVDLMPGGWSKLSDEQSAYLGDGNYARGNVFNALQFKGDMRSLIENVNGGSGSDRITGNGADNFLNGNGGNDVLLGGSGDDTLKGAAGSDRLDGGVGSDQAVFDGAAWDYRVTHQADGSIVIADLRMRAPDSTDILTRIELLQFKNGVLDASTLAPQITIVNGTGGNDILKGTAHVDRISGRNGNDAISSYGGDDTVRAGAGADQLDGGSGHDRLYAFEGKDRIVAGAGDDLLEGGRGADILHGNNGRDTFLFRSISDTGATGPEADLIGGFVQGDKIHLLYIDADATLAGNQAFTFIGKAAFTDAGQISYFTMRSGETRLLLNIDDDPSLEAMIRVAGVHAPNNDWFVL
jgi:serralysin